MSRTLPFGKRLRTTPMRDLLRGRVTGRLDWRTAIEASDLPDAVRERIAEVVHRTGLWRLEQADLAAELIGHFQDAADAGVPESQSLDQFGDAKSVAKLIRRAKRRQRSIAWQGGRAIGWLLVGVGALYAISLAQYLLGRPTPTVDYVAKLNAAALAVPESERAMPIYRNALKQLRPWMWPTEDWLAYQHDYNVQNAKPTSPLWPETAAWLKRNAPLLADLRRAAAMPNLGMVLESDSPQRLNPGLDTPVGWLSSRDAALLPAAAEVLAQDAKLAASEKDGPRLFADLNAMLGVAAHARSPQRIVDFTLRYSMSVALASVQDALAPSPKLLTDEQWIALAHRMADLGPNPLLDTSYRDARFNDLLQYAYTDIGHGDGRPTWAGWLRTGGQRPPEGQLAVSWIASKLSTIAPVAFAGATTWLDSRATAKADYDRLQSLALDQLRRPLREADWTEYLAAREQWNARHRLRPADPLGQIEFIEPFHQSHWEAALGYRDGLTVGIALELFHRRHGHYPATLNELTPNLLPAVPVDRADGQPVRYKLIDGRPLVYSVGADLRDDGGQIPYGIGKDPYDLTMPLANPRSTLSPWSRGDWRLYPRPEDVEPGVD